MTTNRRLLDVILQFPGDLHPARNGGKPAMQRRATETGPPCPHCHRPDCDLLATVIIGERNWHAAVAACVRWQRVPFDGQKYTDTGATP